MRMLCCLAVVLFLGAHLGAATTQVAVAAAADLRGTLEEVAEAFQKANPTIAIQVSYGASGSLTAQIKQGAPFDVFLSADTTYPELLVQAGLATKEGVTHYATGKLVLWVRKALAPDPGKEGLKVLLNPALKRIAMANPKLAPYGRVGEEALKTSGLYEAVAVRLVFAENIAQAAQYLQTGAADAGLISISQARQPALREAGWSWEVPQERYSQLKQGAVVLVRTGVPNEALAFLAFLLGPDGQDILARKGFGRP